MALSHPAALKPWPKCERRHFLSSFSSAWKKHARAYRRRQAGDQNMKMVVPQVLQLHPLAKINEVSQIRVPPLPFIVKVKLVFFSRRLKILSPPLFSVIENNSFAEQRHLASF